MKYVIRNKEYKHYIIVRIIISKHIECNNNIIGRRNEGIRNKERKH